MLDATQVTYGAIARWPTAPTHVLAEPLHVNVTMDIHAASGMPPHTLREYVADAAHDAFRFEAQKRHGGPLAEPILSRVTLDEIDDDGRPVGHFITLLPEGEDAEEPARDRATVVEGIDYRIYPQSLAREGAAQDKPRVP